MTDRKKVVLLDEADMMSSFMQPALRAFMEEFHENCQFILTCNYKDKIIEPLHSRCSLIDFSINKSEKKQVLQTFIKSCIRILKAEDIEFDLKALSTFVMLKFPDFRNTINELQAYGQINKRIDSGILATTRDTDLDHLITYLKEKRFTDMRKWVAENWSMGITEFGKRFEKSTEDLIKKESVPVLVLHLAEYEYKDSFVINKEINLAALCTELMRDLEWQM